MSKAETPAADLWAEMLGKFEAFLPVWCLTHRSSTLDGTGPHTSTPTIREWLQVHSLFRLWYETREFPENSADYARRVAPLFCTTQNEQQTFQAEWQVFFSRQDEADIAQEADQIVETAEEEFDVRRHIESSEAINQGNQRLKRLWWAAALFVILLVVGGGAVDWLFLCIPTRCSDRSERAVFWGAP